jgi:hypothetical protein
MVNRARGEAKITLGGKEFGVALGIGALAELEDSFGVENFEEALNFEKLSAKRLRLFLQAILKGNDIPLTEEIGFSINRFSVPDFMAFVTDLMAASGLSERAESEPEVDGAPLAAERDGEHG